MKKVIAAFSEGVGGALRGFLWAPLNYSFKRVNSDKMQYSSEEKGRETTYATATAMCKNPAIRREKEGGIVRAAIYKARCCQISLQGPTTSRVNRK